MRQILITDAVYNQLQAIADEEGEMIEVIACAYLQRALGEVERLDKQIATLKAETEFNKALLENRQLTTKRH